MRTPSLVLIAGAVALAAGCRSSDLISSGGPTGNTIIAHVAATDVSRPTLPTGGSVDVTGTVTFSGLSVELWDGQRWLSVANGSGSATIHVGDGALDATLVPASEIPAGEYTKARVAATNAAIDLTVNGQSFSAHVGNPNAGPFEIEKNISVSVNPDGSRTFSIELQLIRSVTLHTGSNGAEVELAGDLGAMTVPAATAPARVTATDISTPTDPEGAPVDVSGTVTFTGLSVELWNGTEWRSVVHGSGSADVSIGDGAVSATLVPESAIAAGDYSRVRISATEAVAQLNAVVDGREFAAQVRAPADRPLVIEKDVTVTVNTDGSRTFSVQLTLVRTVAVVPDPATGSARLAVTGELVGQ